MSGISEPGELGSQGGSNPTVCVKRVGASVELALRLWARPPVQERLQPLSWKSDCTAVHLISDLVVACNGVLSPDTPERLMAQFESPQAAIAAAKRIQWALLGFFQEQPTEAVAAAIAVDLSAAASSQAAKPAQILVGQSIYEQLNGVPGLEFRNPGTEGGIYELLWAPPGSCKLFEQVLNPPREAAPIADSAPATRVVRLPGPAAAGGVPAPPASAVQPEVSQSPGVTGPGVTEPPTKGLPPKRIEPPVSGTTEAPLGQIDFRSSGVRRLLAGGAVVAIAAVLLIAMVVHRNAVARRSANQQAETQPAVAAAPAIPSAPPVSQPPVDAVTTPAAETPSAVQSPAPTDAKDDSAHARKGRRIATKDDPPESAAEPAAEKPGGRCQLQGNEISAYLDIADKNRAGGNYDDALREYRAVMECDRRNARAQNGLAKIKQARAISGGDDSEDAR